ncbi:mitochondrial GTPase 1 [Contarinia nasturtii]|uniref:mitochondrial GTPase 1 n=1 Tax=Contarinia nasturtii TaxID=265458 RepID=UPI0012D3E7E4|nr:mitochondrial GTPase 1 [Contarinia nasturtii]
MSYKFRDVFKAVDKTSVHWFPGHMGKGLRQMQQKLKMVDCVIEVHDARIPYSGRNPDFKNTVTGVRPHILVLNKKDLGDKSTYQTIAKDIQTNEGIDHVLFTNCKDQQCLGIKSIVPTAKRLIQGSNRFNRSEQPEFNLMIIGVPNVGKSSLTNVLRNRHLNAKGASQVGAIAGVTRSVLTRIKISIRPLIYMYDTPGILTPHIRNLEHGMKLASVSCMQDNLVGEIQIADYILYWLNKNGFFDYVQLMNLKEPTDSIQEVLLSGALMLNKSMKFNHPDGTTKLRPDFDYAARHFIRAFRSGELGKFNLDHVYSKRNDL